MNFLSIAGSFGALVWIFQEGHLGIAQPRPLEHGLPVLLFCVLFGLSMDYEVLMLSRIKESYERTRDNTHAVAEGLEKTAGLITSAAAIMVVVFAAFALAKVVLIQAVGFGMALAVAIDATLVRLLLVPATMRLFGRLELVGARAAREAAAYARVAMTTSLLAPDVVRTLDRLHRNARTDMWRILMVAPFVVPDFLGFRKVVDARLSRHMRSVYVPVSRSQGQMLYLVARSIDAKRVVEFGTSFGISTLYLAAAMKDNGGGVVIGSEIEPSKHAKAEEHLREAGLAELADVRLGDALETLATVDAPIDMVLLDGWKDLYLPILHLLKPKLKPRAVVLADNIYTFKRALRPYVEYVQNPANGFVSSTLEISDGFELSIFTG